MKIQSSQITRLRLTELVNLDPVEVIADNIGQHQGKVTIICYGRSWTAYWGSTSSTSVEEFFCRCSNDYLIGSLSPGLQSKVPDQDADSEFIKSKVLKARRAGEIDRSKAQSLWSDLYLDVADRETIMYGQPRDVADFLGCEPWHLDWPEVDNPDYSYLSRICDAVKAAFNEQKEVA